MPRLLPLALVVLALAGCGTKDVTPRASGIPSTSTTATTLPPVTTEPPAEAKVLADCLSTSARPKQIVLACADANLIADDIRWDSWGADAASGAATMQVNLCEPNCAADTQRPFPAAVRLDEPVGGVFTEMVVTWTGQPPFGHSTDTYDLATTPIG